MILHTIYTGCSRPALYLGVPIVVLVLSALGALLAAGSAGMFISGWAVLPVVLSFIVFYAWARTITRMDEWRLSQVALKLKVRGLRGFRRTASSVTYVAYKFEKRRP